MAVTDAPLVRSRSPVVVIVDNLHVKYRVYTSGKAVKGNAAASGLLQNARAGFARCTHCKASSFMAYENESIGVIGSNGSGKSTLMRAITGLDSARSPARSTPPHDRTCSASVPR